MGLIGKLNEKNKERLIKDMEVGEIGYTVPWALEFDLNRIPYLDIYMSISERRGTSQLKIRTGSKESDYDVDIRNIDYNWRLSDHISKDCVKINTDEDEVIEFLKSFNF